MFTHFDRGVFLTGDLCPPVMVDTNQPLKPQQYSVQTNQDINLDNLYMQGGPGKSVSDFNKKIIKGGVQFKLRLKENNLFEDSVINLLTNAQSVEDCFTLTTLLQPYSPTITAESAVYSNGSDKTFLMDTCVVESATITIQDTAPCSVDFNIIGQNNSETPTNIAFPPEDTNLYRDLTWVDCGFYRNGSRMENLTKAVFKIIKTIDQPVFLMTYGTSDRYDRSYSTGVKSIGVEFEFTENVTSLVDIFSYSFGGNDKTANFNGSVGPMNVTIPETIVKISSQNLSETVIQRVTSGYYRLMPNTPFTNGYLLSF